MGGARYTNGWSLGNQWQGARPSMVGTKDSMSWAPGKIWVCNRKLVAWARGNGWLGPGHQWLWDREQKAEVQENKCLWPKEAMVGVHENNGWCPGNQMFLLMRVRVGVQDKMSAVQKHKDYVTLNQVLARMETKWCKQGHQCCGSTTSMVGVQYTNCWGT